MSYYIFSQTVYTKIKEDVVFYLSEDKTALQIGLILGAITIFLISAHIIADQFSNSSHQIAVMAAKIHYNIDIGRENSFSERFNHGVLFASALLLLGVSLESRSCFSFFLSTFVGFAWLDDSSSYHERMGGFLAEILVLPSAFGLQPENIGELLGWGLAAIVLLPLAIWSYLRRRPGDDVVLRLMAFPLLALIVCAVAFDAIHVAVQSPAAERLFLVLEDGGEMLASVAIATVSVAVLRNVRRIYGPAAPSSTG